MEVRRAERERVTLWDLVVVFIALSYVLVLNGAVPGLMNPDYSLAIFHNAFSYSFLNEGLGNVYAVNFGYPTPSPSPFGLPQSYLAAIFIALGMHGSDAYTLMMGLHLTVGFMAFVWLAHLLKINMHVAIVAAVLWFSLPIVRAHEGFGPIIAGIALLPLYWAASLSLSMDDGLRRKRLLKAFCFFFLVLYALFTDGYTFMMFALMSSVMLLFDSSPISGRWKRRLVLATIWVLSFGGAYIIYAAYIGGPGYGKYPTNVYVYFSSALAYLALPNKGESLIADKLGWSVARTSETHFGDPTVWTTSFSAPLLMAVLVLSILLGLTKTTRLDEKRPLWRFLLIALLGLYFALGPVIKTDPMAFELKDQPPFWDDEFDIPSYWWPTGLAWVHEHVPGFTSMRAAYRWSALAGMALVAFLMVGVARISHLKFARAFLVIPVILMTPNVQERALKDFAARGLYIQVESGVDRAFEGVFPPGELLLFLPYSNDFLISYIAARHRLRSFNTGQDKVLAAAKANWPDPLQRWSLNSLQDIDASSIEKFLLMREADAIVFPWFDGQTGVWAWPCTGNQCVTEKRARADELIAAIRLLPTMHVSDHQYFSVVTLSEDTFGQLYPLAPDRPILFERILHEGWYQLESNGVWSKSNASIRLLRNRECRVSGCEVTLRYRAFGASSERPANVKFFVNDGRGRQSISRVTKAEEILEEKIAVWGDGNVMIDIEVPTAASPDELHGVPGERILGIFLMEVDYRGPESGVISRSLGQ